MKSESQKVGQKVGASLWTTMAEAQIFVAVRRPAPLVIMGYLAEHSSKCTDVLWLKQAFSRLELPSKSVRGAPCKSTRI